MLAVVPVDLNLLLKSLKIKEFVNAAILALL